MAAICTQLRGASTELAKFHHSSSIVRCSHCRYARLSLRVKLLCCQSQLLLEATAMGTEVYDVFGSTRISKRLLETTTIGKR